MAKARQLLFGGFKDHARTQHGGELGHGKRKLARPIATKRPMHLVLRASTAMGERSMLRVRHHSSIQSLIFRFAKKNHIKIFRFANAGNHLHLLIQAKTRDGFKSFLRTISGLIARLITKAVKGRPQGQFWDALAFTQVVEWGKHFERADSYVLMNAFEAFGISSQRKPGFTDAVLLGFS